MKLYKVKTGDNSYDNINGFLAAFGRVMYYSIGQAKRKASFCKGTLVPVEVRYKHSEEKTLVLEYVELPQSIQEALEGREAFESNDRLVSIYSAEVLSDIFDSGAIRKEDDLEQVEILMGLSFGYDYIRVNK